MASSAAMVNPNIAVNCIRETGANVLEVMAGLREVMGELNQDILNPKGLMLSQVYDETEYINSSIKLVQENIFLGGALTMIVLMSFLHLGYRTIVLIPAILATSLAAIYLSPWWFVVCLAIIIGAGFWYARGALVVGLAIPTSIIGTFLVLGMLGRSLNVISLAGLAFAVGMLVDNAIVVLENIFRRYSLGESALDASARGTEEVWGAVVSSTLTTIAVFLPVVFIQEEAGQLFRDIALAITAAVGLSLIVSVTVIPTAASRLFRGSKREDLLEDLSSLGGDAPKTQKKSSIIVRMLNGFGGLVRRDHCRHQSLGAAWGCSSTRHDWSIDRYLVGSELAALAQGGISPQWQPQSRVRHCHPTSRLQHRSTHVAG